jgi:hypothetical protein
MLVLKHGYPASGCHKIFYSIFWTQWRSSRIHPSEATKSSIQFSKNDQCGNMKYQDHDFSTINTINLVWGTTEVGGGEKSVIYTGLILGPKKTQNLRENEVAQCIEVSLYIHVWRLLMHCTMITHSKICTVRTNLNRLTLKWKWIMLKITGSHICFIYKLLCNSMLAAFYLDKAFISICTLIKAHLWLQCTKALINTVL